MIRNSIYKRWSINAQKKRSGEKEKLGKMVELHSLEFRKRSSYDYIMYYLAENNTDVERVAHIIANIDELTCKDFRRVHAHCSCVPF